MKEEQIIAVKKVAAHLYDDIQGEMAYYAKSNKRPGFRWYVAYGGDEVPAAKKDLKNLAWITDVDTKNIVTEEDEKAAAFLDTWVQMYRDGR